MTQQKSRAGLGDRGAAGDGTRGQVASLRPVYHGTGAGSMPIFVGAQVVGGVRGDCFCKTVRASVHQLRRPAAWCFDVVTLDQAEAAGARFAEIHDQESGKTWRAAISTIRQKGFPVRRGFGEQVGLLLSDFGQDDAPGVQLGFAWGLP